MRVLIVGGAGYIGSHTARALRRAGHEPVIYDNLCTGYRQLASGFDLVEGDIRDSAKLGQALRGTAAAMYFAAHAYVGESVQNPRKYFDNNVMGGLDLLNTAIDSGVKKIVFSSSCAVYGVPAEVPIRERAIRQPVSPYGETKMIFELALADYDRAYNLKYASLRYFNAAGADDSGEIGELHEPETHLIPRALAAAAGTIPHLEVFGNDYPTPDGTCVRDYIDVHDLADAHVRALEALVAGKESLIVNLGTGHGDSVKEVIAAVEEVTGRRVLVKFGPRRAGDPPVLVADPSLAQQILGWKAQRSLRDSVRTAWAWMQRSAVTARR